MKQKGFTLIELLVVIVIVAILAAAITPGYVHAVAKAKWAEANAAAGTIRTAVRTYAVEAGVTQAQTLAGSNLGNASVQLTLRFGPFDLDGTYFTSSDFTINGVDATGAAEITVTGGSKPSSPAGTYKLQFNGNWVKQ